MSSICIVSNAGILYHIFDDYSGLYSIACAQSPARVTGNSTQEKYVGVISKKNQPRNVGALGGTNPHQGTDFIMTSYENFYPMLPGVVFDIRDDTSNDQLGYVIIKSTINNQDYYIKYLHIVPDAQLVVNQQVLSDTVLGTVQYSYTYPPAHVHVSCSAYSNMSITTELFPFFRHNDQYNFGADMDFICGEEFDGNFLYIYAYIRSETSSFPYGTGIDCEKVRLYYNINNSGWNSGNFVDYDTNDYYIPAVFKYQLNLYETGLHCGDTIKLYLVAFRSNSNSADNTFYNSSSMNFGVSPMYYLQPDEYLGTNAQYYEYTLNQTHDWTAWEVTMQSTCSTFGKESRSCNNCGATEERSLPKNLSNHSGGSHWETVTNPTCTAPGSKELICDGCSAVLDTDSIPAPGHSMGSWYTATASTCCTCGTERSDCSECGYYVESPLPLNSSNHTGGSHWETVTNPTCTTQGSMNLVCNGCGAVLDTDSIPAPGHSMGSWYTVTASTCYTNGTQRRDCSECSYYEEGSLGILSHIMSGWSVHTLSTCHTPGTQSRNCTRTGCSYIENDSLPLNPNNHSGGTYWTVTTTATCTASGIRSQICYGCSAVLSTQAIPALGHSWGAWIYQYQYYDEDLQYYVRVYKRTCSRCGIYEYDYLD